MTDHLPDEAQAALVAQGLDPQDYDIKSMWQDHTGEMRYSFKTRMRPAAASAPLTPDELSLLHMDPEARLVPAGRLTEGQTAIVPIADCQIGKAQDAEHVTAVVGRTFHLLDRAHADLELRVLQGDPIERVVIAFLGDEIEGFVSQGGANIWQTPMPLTQQIRLVRSIMIYALKRFHSLGLPMVMLAIPGNHDQAVRQPGMTTYDDSHDVEALRAVMDGAQLSEVYDDVEFLFPETNELTVALDLSGTKTVFVHGHMASNQKRTMEWVKGQAFNRNSSFADSDLVITGHWHSFYIECSGTRTLITAPTLEYESTWYRHKAGVGGNPGLLTLLVSNGEVTDMKMHRG